MRQYKIEYGTLYMQVGVYQTPVGSGDYTSLRNAKSNLEHGNRTTMNKPCKLTMHIHTLVPVLREKHYQNHSVGDFLGVKGIDVFSGYWFAANQHEWLLVKDGIKCLLYVNSMALNPCLTHFEWVRCWVGTLADAKYIVENF